MKKTTEQIILPSLGRIPKIGLWAWSFVGVVIALIFIAIAFGAVSSVLLPLIFAAVLAIIFKPLSDSLQRKKIPSTLAASSIVLGLLLTMVAVISMTVQGVADQFGEISATADSAIETTAEYTESVGIDEASLDSAKSAVEDAQSKIAPGILSGIFNGLGAVISLATGIILGSLIMYYFLKDGKNLRRSLVSQLDAKYQAEFDDFISDACQTLRSYGKGRTIMSLLVSLFIGVVSIVLGLPLVLTIVFVNFIGGYIPYIGAFIGGGLAVVVALGEGGLPTAALMFGAVLVANLVLENFVQPKVMSNSLDTHPVMVLIVTALGGLLGGLVGLILAVPAYVIATKAVSRLRSRGVVKTVQDQVQPAMQQILDQ